MLGAKAGVRTDIPDGGVYIGIPATPEREQAQKQVAWAKLPEMRREFLALQKQIADLAAQLEESRRCKVA
jgi:UDP-3-O-[3-hydroxymyristoyl] glucosamine N-acyltransferase